ncbi:MAG: TRAP-type mannitol/chloroaromatic compound transport system, periplasmic component [Rhodobacteraceae bacterium HLUCCA09]|nr:MAG: TRAP-type mannitol/chloroaromatic compound transport system, periplasmic component [Rhodobacteraceae bacterium HLUCCA09]
MRHARTPLAALALAAGLAAPAAAQEYSFRMATIDVETGNYFNFIAVPFAELVSELTGGDVEIQPLPAGTVGSVFRLHEALDDGLVDMVNWPAAFLGNEDPFNSMINTFPTGLGSDSILAWLYYGGGEELLTAHRAETMGVHSIILGSGPAEWFAHSHVPIETVEDLEGKRYRTLGNWAAIVSDKFGAAAATTPGSEVYSMLERQGLDLAEYSLPGENFNQGLHETAEYIIYPGIHAPGWSFELMVGMDQWEELPDAYKTAIETAARLVSYDSMQRTMLADMDAVRKINERAEAGQNTLLELDQEFRDAAEAAAREWAVETAAAAAEAGNEWPQRVVDSLFPFQDAWRASSYYMVTDTRQ